MVLVALDYLLRLPEAYELVAAVEEFCDDPGGSPVGVVGRQCGAQAGSLGTTVALVVFFGVDQALGGVGEPAVVGAAGQAGVAGLVAAQREKHLR